MADVYLGSVYASLELKTNNLKSQLNHAESMFSGLDSAAAKSGSTGETAANKMAAAFGAVAGVVQSVTTRAFDALTASIDGGIKRFDTMNNFPKVMQNVGVSTEQSAAVIDDLSEKLKGLPTSLDAGAAAVQRFTMTTKDVQKSEDWFLALNDAILSGGASMDLQATALEQFTQMLAVGKPDMMAWRSVIRAMPAQMDMLARSMGYVSGEAGGDLYEAFLKGKVSANDLMDAMVKLDKEGSEGIRAFKDTAFDATGGISTQLANLKNAMNRFWQTVFTSIGSDNIRTVLSGLYDGIGKLAKVVGNFVSKVMPTVMTLMEKLGPVFEKLLDTLGNILSSQAVEVVITAIANALGFLADVLAKIPTEVLSNLIMGFIAFKQVNKFLPIMKGVGNILGNLGSKFKLFNGAEKLGKGVGSAIAAVLKPLGSTEVLKGAASAALASAGLVLIAVALDKAMKIDYDLGKLLAFAACVTASAGIMALIGTFGQYAIIGGIATAVISGGLLLAALALKEVSDSAGQIDLGRIVAFEGILAVVSAIMAAISGFAVFGAIGGIASGIIGGGLMVAAVCLAQASKSVDDIKMDKLVEFSGMLAQVDIILGLISGFAVFGAIGGVANAILSGGLLVSAIALKETSDRVKDVDGNALVQFSGTLATVDVILGVLSGFAVLGAIASVANDIISGGLLVAAIALRETANVSKDIDPSQIDKLNGVIATTNLILSAMSLFSIFAGIGTLMTDVISGGVLVAAKGLVEATKYAKQLNDGDLDKLERMLQKIGSWDTGGLLNNIKNVLNTGILAGVADNVKNVVNSLNGLKPLDDEIIESLNRNVKKLSELDSGGVLEALANMWNSGNLAQVATNVRSIMEDLSNIKSLPSNDAIESLKDAVHRLSQIKIEGSGLFENKGGAAEELAFIVWKICDMANNLSTMKQIDYGKVESNVNAIKLFDRIDDNARNGIRRLNDLGDALGNIDWIKRILGDLPTDIWSKVEHFVSSIKLFDRIDNNARDGVRRLNDLGDSLGNINWIKAILGDININYGNVETFINAVKLFDRIDENARAGAMRLAGMRDALANIDWIKHILGDIPADIASKAEALVNAIKKFDGVSVDDGKLQNVANALNNLKNTIVNQMAQMTSIMQQSGVQTAQSYVSGFQSKIGDARNQGVAMGNALKDGLSSVNNSLTAVGQSAQGAYWRGIQGKMNDEYQQGKAMGNQFRQGLYDVDYGNAGYWAVVGFKNGALSQNVYSTGWQIANSFLQGLKDRGRQGSPWKTTYQSGVWAGEGFADGILKSESMVENAANKIADVAISAMNMDEMGNMMVSPDMSSVSASMAQVIGKIEAGDKDSGSETNIYGDIYITPNGDDEDVLDELSRATSMVDRGMATRV